MDGDLVGAVAVLKGAEAEDLLTRAIEGDLKYFHKG